MILYVTLLHFNTRHIFIEDQFLNSKELIQYQIVK